MEPYTKTHRPILDKSSAGWLTSTSTRQEIHVLRMGFEKSPSYLGRGPSHRGDGLQLASVRRAAGNTLRSRQGLEGVRSGNLRLGHKKFSQAMRQHQGCA